MGVLSITVPISSNLQIYADFGQIPTIWKMSIVIPIPKSKNSKELSEFIPVALMSLIIKNFENILKNIIVSFINGKLNPLQFACQPDKGKKHAKLFILDTECVFVKSSLTL